jgi:hypothetical protein
MSGEGDGNEERREVVLVRMEDPPKPPLRFVADLLGDKATAVEKLVVVSEGGDRLDGRNCEVEDVGEEFGGKGRDHDGYE